MGGSVVADNDSSLSLTTVIGYTFLIMFLTYLLQSLFKLYSNYQKMKNIPGVIQYFEKAPFKIPILAPYFYIASFFETEKQANKFFKENNCNLMRIVTAANSIVCTNDPKLLKEVFITKANSFDKTELSIAKIFGENIVTVLHTEEWKKHFKICSPAFSPTNLKYMCKVTVESVDQLFERWNSKIEEGNGSCLLTKQDLSDITFQVLGKAGFNLDFGVFSQNDEGRKFKNALHATFTMKTMIIKGIFKSNFIGRIIEKAVGITDAVNHCSDALDKIIGERREKLKSGDMTLDETSDILTRLVEANISEKLISDSELKSNAVVMALAGHDTTSTLLQWVLYELSKRPDIQDTLCEEINKVLNGRDPTMDDFEQLSYVNSVLMETLRKDSPVIVNGRVATKDATLGNHVIPKGTTVYTLFNSLHKREDIWEKPNEFIPDRFINPATKDAAIQNLNWIPFSLGNRQCIGKKFSLLESCMILSCMATKFRFKLLNDETVDPVVNETLPMNQPSSNMRIQISLRN